MKLILELASLLHLPLLVEPLHPLHIEVMVFFISSRFVSLQQIASI